MKIPEYHHSNFLISVHFDNENMPDTHQGKIERCEDFLEDLGSKARANGKRLYATYSVVGGQNDVHAHFALSWLPLVARRVKTAKMSEQPIALYAVKKLLEENYFYVDNQRQAIKRVTHDKQYVTAYVIEQWKDGQTTIFSAFYVHPDFVPRYSEWKIQSYCFNSQFGGFEKSRKFGCLNKLHLISSVIVSVSIMISSLFHVLI